MPMTAPTTTADRPTAAPGSALSALASLAVLCMTVLCPPALAGGPNMHWAQGYEALYHIEDPALRELLQLDEIVEMATNWHDPTHHRTIRLEVVEGTPYLLGRRNDGLQTWKFEDDRWVMLTHGDLIHTDANGFDAPEYSDTFRTAVVGRFIYAFIRSSDGISVRRLDTAEGEWAFVQGLPHFSDANGFDQPVYYETVRTEVFGTDIYLLIRATNGMRTHRLDTTTGTWSGLPTLGSVSDPLGFGSLVYTHTIRTEAVGDVLHVLIRAGDGIRTYRMDTTAPSLGWTSLPTLTSFGNAQGYDQPQYYETMRTAVIEDELFVMMRASTGLRVVRFDTAAPADGWSSLPTLGAVSDPLGFDRPEYYETLRVEPVGSRLHVMIRAGNGLRTYVMDTAAPASGWPSRPTIPSVSDPQGFNHPEYYSTLRTAAVGDDVYLTIRSSQGVLTYRLDTTSTGPWEAVLFRSPKWSDGGFSNHPFFMEQKTAYEPSDSQAARIYLAYQCGLWFPDAFNQYPTPLNALEPPDVWFPHGAEFLYEYGMEVAAHVAERGVEGADPLLVAHFLGCLGHVVGDSRFDRYFVQRVMQECGKTIPHPTTPSDGILPELVFPGIVPGTTESDAQVWTDIILDLSRVWVGQMEFGVPRPGTPASDFILPDVVTRPGGVLDRAYPHLSSDDDVRDRVLQIQQLLNRYIASSNPTQYVDYAPLNVGQCAWSQENFRTARGGVLDTGRAIAGAIDRTWAFLVAGELPRFEIGNQTNQSTHDATQAGRALGFPWTDLSIGRDVGVPGFAEEPFPGYAVEDHADAVAWLPVHEYVLQYEVLGELTVVLTDAPGGTRLEASCGFLGDAWYDWTPGSLTGAPIESFRIERLPSAEGTVRIAARVEGGELHVFDRSSELVEEPSPDGVSVGFGVSGYALDGDLIGFLSGGTLRVQSGLLGVPEVPLSEPVDRFQLEDGRVGALVSGRLLLRETPVADFLPEADEVAEFALDDGAVAVLTTDQRLRARWGWNRFEPAPQLLQGSLGWSEARHHDTLRTAVVDGDVYLLGRGRETGDQPSVYVHRLDPDDGSWSLLADLDDFPASDGWDDPEHRATLRTVVVGARIVLLGRGPNGLVARVFDTGANMWLTETLDLHGVWTDAEGWDEAAHYDTIRCEVVGDDVLVLGRGPTGVEVHRLDTASGAWTASPAPLVAMTDAGGWDQPERYATIRTEVVGELLYLFGRGPGGLVTHVLDIASHTWLPGDIGLSGAFPDVDGFDQPAAYETIRTAVLGADAPSGKQADKLKAKLAGRQAKRAAAEAQLLTWSAAEVDAEDELASLAPQLEAAEGDLAAAKALPTGTPDQKKARKKAISLAKQALKPVAKLHRRASRSRNKATKRVTSWTERVRDLQGKIAGLEAALAALPSPAGPAIAVIARGPAGLETLVLRTEDGTWDTSVERLPAFTDAEGWSAPSRHGSLRVAVADGALHVLGRSRWGVETYRWGPGQGSWQSVARGFPDLTDGAGFGMSQYGDTIRAEAIGSSLFLLTRAADGLRTYRLDAGGGTWRTLGSDVTAFRLERGDLVWLAETELSAGQLGRIPATLGPHLQWTPGGPLTTDPVSEFTVGDPPLPSATAPGSTWVSWRTIDGTCFKRNRPVGKAWRYQLATPGDPADALLRLDHLAPQWLAHRISTLVDGVLYQQESPF